MYSLQEIRSQFMGDNFLAGSNFKPLEDAVKEGHRKLESQLGRVKNDPALVQVCIYSYHKSLMYC